MLLERLEAAGHALGRLDGLSASLDPDLLLYAYVRKEAVLSSQIEGTQSTLSDLLQYEGAAAPGVHGRQLDILNRTDFDPPLPAEPRFAFEAEDFVVPRDGSP